MTTKRQAKQQKKAPKTKRVKVKQDTGFVKLNAVPKVGNAWAAPKASSKHRMGLVETVCGITDPFCPKAVGARWPDGQGTRTFTASFRGTFTMTTAATGGISVAAMTPSHGFGYTTIGATALPATPTFFSQFSNAGGSSLYNTYADQVRVVSAGAIVRAIQTASTAQGYFTLQTQQDFTAGTSAIAGDYLALDTTTIANSPGMEISYVFQPTNKVNARLFSAKNNSSNIPASSYGWPALVIYYQGGAAGATNVAIVEYYVHVEFTVGAESSLSSLAPPAHPPAPQIIKAQDKVTAKAAGVIKGGVDAVGSKIVDWATTSISDTFKGMSWEEELASVFALL